MIKNLKLKLAKMLSKFSEVTTDKGVLLSDGELVVGAEVYLIDADGEYVTAPDGEYIVEDITYVVLDGMISEIKSEVGEVFETETEVETVVVPVLEDILKLIEELDKRITAIETSNTNVITEVEGFKKIVSKLSAGKPIDELLKDNSKEESRIERLSSAISKNKRK